MKCQCESCTDTPAPTYTEAFKQECLKRHRKKYQAKAREVMMWPDEKKHRYYDKFVEQCGEENAKKFIEEVNRQLQLMRNYK